MTDENLSSDQETLSERLERRDQTIDTTALINDLDREGFDFTPYILPKGETA